MELPRSSNPNHEKYLGLGHALAFTGTMAAVFFLMACGQTQPVHEGFTKTQQLLDKGGIRFSDVDQIVIEQHCAKCHHAGGNHSDLTNLTKMMAMPRMIVPGEPKKSLLYQKIADGSMPPRETLGSAEGMLVLRWIAEGASQ